jgi:hypothetical protein
MNFAEWGWPQYTYAGLTAIGFVYIALHHGEGKKPGVWDVYKTSFHQAIILVILYAGGFFK